MMPTMRYRGTRQEFMAELRDLLKALAGRGPDPTGGRLESIKIDIGRSVLRNLYWSFVAKSQGGTDEMGISWPKLSPYTVAKKGFDTILVELGGLALSLHPDIAHPDQILRTQPGEVEVGSLRRAHNGQLLLPKHDQGRPPRLPRRQIFPESEAQWPQKWIDDIKAVIIEAVLSPKSYRKAA